MKETVVILGASPKRERYSNQALRMLREYGHTPLPVNPGQDQIEGLPVFRRLEAIRQPVDTVTLYLSPPLSKPLAASIVALKPRRVIFNPGTESDELAAQCEAAGIEVQEACTLVLLRTGQFE